MKADNEYSTILQMTRGQHSMGWYIISHPIFPFILGVKKTLCGLQAEMGHGCSVS